MPRLEIVRYYRCKICNRRHGSKTGAVECENRGLAIPEFFERQAVFALVSGDQTIPAVIYEEAFEDETAPHRLPGYYEIFVRDANAPTETKSRTIEVHRENIKPMSVNEMGCPFCRSRDLSIYTEKAFRPFCQPWFYLKNVKMMKCSDCGMRFLSDNQKIRVEAQIAVWLKRESKKHRIADTKKLIKDHEFYS